LIDILGADRHVLGDVVVVVPGAMIKLDEPHAPLRQSPRQQAVRGKAAIARLFDSIHFQHVRRLARKIG
jgi:hypothetical protein